MKPLKLIPPIKDYIWGGTRLRDEYGKQSNLERLAESWELACHNDGSSIIADGEYAGKTLPEYLAENPEALGKSCDRFTSFPVLIKLIDARDNLSVQVHPDNEYALRVEGEYGKTEMWYIVDCEEGASLIYGFKEEISKEDFKKAIEENTLLDKVNVVPVKKGDVFFIEAGTLHAIGKGILIAEIQQNSNTTYRVYDYGRIGADGNPRELHIEKALEVTDTKPITDTPDYAPISLNLSTNTVQNIAFCDYFVVNKVDCIDTHNFYVSDSFIHILVLEGEGVLKRNPDDDFTMELKKGSSVFIPANSGYYKITGKLSIITTGEK